MHSLGNGGEHERLAVLRCGRAEASEEQRCTVHGGCELGDVAAVAAG